MKNHHQFNNERKRLNDWRDEQRANAFTWAVVSFVVVCLIIHFTKI